MPWIEFHRNSLYAGWWLRSLSSSLIGRSSDPIVSVVKHLWSAMACSKSFPAFRIRSELCYALLHR